MIIHLVVSCTTTIPKQLRMNYCKQIFINYIIPLIILAISIAFTTLIYALLDELPKTYRTDSLSSPGMDNAFEALFWGLIAWIVQMIWFARRLMKQNRQLPNERLKTINTISFFWLPGIFILSYYI